MSKALVVGGANGIGLAISHVLAEQDDIEKVYIVDKVKVASEFDLNKFESIKFDLSSDNFDLFDNFEEVDILIITAGFGKLALFDDIEESYITDSFKVNAIAPIKIIKKFYHRINSKKRFMCMVMGSISGFMSSPFFSVYSATKASLKIFIESVNVELEKSGSVNRILNVCPGSINGTSFANGETKLQLIKPLAEDFLNHLYAGEDLYIPQYEEIFKYVLERYHKDFRAEGRHSYDYKMNSGRINNSEINKII